MVFFALQNLVSLIMSQLFKYVFISTSLGDWPKKTLVQFMSEDVLPMLPSSGFIVLWLVFKSLSHFQFILVHDIKLYPNLIDLDAAVQISWRRQWQPTPVLLPGKSHGWRNLVGCRKESDMTEWIHFHFSLSCIGEGNGNPLQCSCLETPRDGGAW